ncbi:MAG: phosphotransferase [Pseudomonadota bacterium]
MSVDADITAFLQRLGWHKAMREAMAGDASSRVYTRLRAQDGGTAILVQAPVEGSPHPAFRRIAAWLTAQGLSTPEVYGHDDVAGLMLLEDFGPGGVDVLTADGAREAELYGLACDVLGAVARAEAPVGLTEMTPEGMADMAAPLFEAIPDQGRAAALKATFDARAPEVFGALFEGTPVVALRDYHAANLVYLPERAGVRALGLLDFQDAVLAPVGYDLASLVDDVRRVVPGDLRGELIGRHAAELGWDEGALARQVDLLSLQRNLRVLGLFQRFGGRYAAFVPRCRALIEACANSPAGAPLRGVCLKALEALSPVERVAP